ncbi:MAG: glycosyl transferase family 1, partial [Bacteroidales bacterium]|nr:glycosyl transferase family 1 [Bacteroidales bacterium]
VNEDGVSGLNVPVRDAKAIAQAVMDICSDEKRYAEYVKEAAGRYERLFTLDRMIENLVKIYDIK